MKEALSVIIGFLVGHMSYSMIGDVQYPLLQSVLLGLAAGFVSLVLVRTEENYE